MNISGGLSCSLNKTGCRCLMSVFAVIRIVDIKLFVVVLMFFGFRGSLLRAVSKSGGVVKGTAAQRTFFYRTILNACHQTIR